MMSKDTADTLRRAKAKIATPETWTKEDYAKDADGMFTDARSPKATCWCSMGAIQTVCSEEDWTRITRALRIGGLGSTWVDEFNDASSTTHADVLAMFDRAIAAEESAP